MRTRKWSTVIVGVRPRPDVTREWEWVSGASGTEHVKSKMGFSLCLRHL